MQADDRHVETREKNRIPNILAAAGGVLAAGLGLVVLLGWVLGLPLLSGPEPRWIPMAPSSALSFVSFGTAVFFSARSPLSRGAFVFTLVAAGLVSVGYVHFRDYAQHYRTEVERQLSAVAELKAGELVAWRSERLADATVLFRSAVFAALVRRASENPKDLEAQEQLHGWLRQVRDAYRYAQVSLMDTRGVARISIPDIPLPANAAEHAREALRSGQIAFLDFYRDAPGAAIHLSILIPIVGANIAGAKEGDRPLGVVVLDIDPSQYLYPLIQRWPTPSRSAETLLVRRDGNDVLFLNELRFQKNTALALRIPLDNMDVPAVQAALGQEGIVEGVDYRGVPVIAAVRAVPGSPWFLIARVDTAEVFDPITEHLWLTVSLIGALLLAAGTTVGLVWWHQRVRHYRERLRAGEALRESEDRYGDLVENSQDLICTHNLEGRLLSVNAAAVRLTGYSREALLGMNMADLLTRGARDGFAAYLAEIRTKGAARGLMQIRTADGKRRWWEYQNTLRVEGVDAPVVRGMAQDITERKRAEEDVRQMAQMVDTAPSSIAVHDFDGRYLYANQKTFDLHGFSPDEFMALTLHQLDVPASERLITARMQELRDRGEAFFEVAHFRKDRTRLPLEVRAKVTTWGGKKVILSVATDITERKQAEQTLHDYARRLQSVSRRLIEVEDSVRRNINRELHDRVGANLSALNLNLSIVRSQLPQESLGVVGARLEDTQKLLEETTTHVRDLMADLHPPALDDYGLLAALRTYVHDLGARVAVPIGVHGEDLAPRLPLAAETALFRVAQGALTNAVTHAQAKRIEILLAASADRVALAIVDDGAGFDAAQAAQAHASWGLAIMRERSEAVGARLTVESTPGKGTRVCVEISREKR